MEYPSTAPHGVFVSGTGPDVVLLHSSMSSKSQWLPLISDLKHGFRMMALDLFGYGDCGFPLDPESFATDDEARQVVQTLDHFLSPGTPFHLIGHSYGGAIALKLATAGPGRILSLTVFEPVVFHLLDKQGLAWRQIKKVVSEIHRFLKIGGNVSATRVFIDYWSGPGTFERLHSKNRTAFALGIEKVALDFQALFNETLGLEDYAGLDIPVCMIKGEKSPAAPLEIFNILQQAMAPGCVYTVSGGHMSPITHFKEVNRVIQRFLKGFPFN